MRVRTAGGSRPRRHPGLRARVDLRRHRPAGLVEREGVTHVNLTPTVLATLDPAAFSRSLTVVSAGEVLSERTVAAWAGHRLYNGYGPTECTVGATLGPVAHRGPVTIGLPMAGKTVRILDPRLRPVPTGVVGELYVGGAGLARGYHGAPAATAGRFVADPFAPGARLFRTGDLAQVRADGSVEYVGRSDDQVQINGVRVEPSEVDAALAAAPSIRTSATVPIRQSNGERTLVSYVVARAGADLDAAQVRADLARLLPRHLVPSAVVNVERIPTTPGGKVDRAALPDPYLGVLDQETTPPQGPVERAVAAAMADVLGRGSVPGTGTSSNSAEPPWASYDWRRDCATTTATTWRCANFSLIRPSPRSRIESSPAVSRRIRSRP
ncbi:AMP-binding protein [Rhodococcus hoagii]|nr:AMP-binding protein [Prescottella equi]